MDLWILRDTEQLSQVHGLIRRYWIPIEVQPIVDEQGFLVDPGLELGSAYNPQAKTLEELADKPALVLLGGARSGKSTDLRRYVGGAGQHRVSYWSKSDQGNEAAGDWIIDATNQGREVIVDHSHLETMPDDELVSLTGERGLVRLRVAMRPTPSFVERLSIFIEAGYEIYKLAPFTRGQFFELIGNINVAPANNTSLALSGLAGNLAPGLLGELQPPSIDRVPTLFPFAIKHSLAEAIPKGSGESDASLWTTSLLAALTKLCRKHRIVLHPKSSAALPASVLSVAEYRDFIQPKDQNIEIVLGSTLFTPTGIGEYSWSSTLVEDYLCAYWLAHADLRDSTLMELATSLEEQVVETVPYLREVVGWAASWRPTVFKFMLSHDPFSLLRSHALYISREQRASLVEAYFEGLQASKASHVFVSDRQWYWKLCHDAVGIQLKTHLDRRAGLEEKLTALAISGACRTSSLTEIFFNIALSSDEPYDVRKQALRAIESLNSNEDVAKLRPLLSISPVEDPDDDILGIVLSILWPKVVSTAEAFHFLRPRQQTNLLAEYGYFLGIEFEPKTFALNSEETLSAMLWLQDRRDLVSADHYFERIATGIISSAWSNLKDPQGDIAQELAGLLLSEDSDSYELLGIVRNIVEQKSRENEDRRRALLTAIVARMTKANDWHQLRPYELSNIIAAESFDWLLSRFDRADVDEAGAWATLLSLIVGIFSPAQHGAIYNKALDVPALKETFAFLWSPIDLNSDHATRLRSWASRERERAERTRAHSHDTLDLEALRKVVREATAGSLAAWAQIGYYLWRNADGHTSIPRGFFDKAPHWKELDEKQKESIHQASLAVFRRPSEAPANSIYSEGRTATDLHIYWLLRHVFAHDNTLYNTLDSESLRSWLPFLTNNYSFVRKDDPEPKQHSALLGILIERDPESVFDAIRDLVLNESRRHGSAFSYEQLLSVSLQLVEDFLLNLAEDEELHSNVSAAIISDLMARRSHRAYEYALKMLERSLSSAPPSIERATALSMVLVSRSPEIYWNRVWNASQDENYRLSFVHRLASLSLGESSRVFKHLSEAQVGELLEWIFRRFPIEDDDVREESGWVTPRQEVTYFRHGLLNELAQRSTVEAVHALLILRDSFPQYGWLSRLILEARSRIAESKWRALTLSDPLFRTPRSDSTDPSNLGAS